VLGLEFITNKEFGNYLNFRNSLSDSSATVLIKKSFYTTLGFSSEIISYTSFGCVGFKYSYALVLGREYSNPKTYDIYSPGPIQPYDISTLTTSLTYKKYTGYLQANFGKIAGGLKFGFVYRL
jgi:hypothetical protein